LFSEIESHWMMAAGALLVVAGFIGLGFSWYMNRAPAEDNLHPEPPPPGYGNRRMMISCERWQRRARALPKLDGYSIAVLRLSKSAPRFSE
jgi:hypothetical protein